MQAQNNFEMVPVIIYEFIDYHKDNRTGVNKVTIQVHLCSEAYQWINFLLKHGQQIPDKFFGFLFPFLL